MSHLLLV
jgi:hypothetical protein